MAGLISSISPAGQFQSSHGLDRQGCTNSDSGLVDLEGNDVAGDSAARFVVDANLLLFPCATEIVGGTDEQDGFAVRNFHLPGIASHTHGEDGAGIVGAIYADELSVDMLYRTC